jgi:hypothetical protein
MAREIARQNHYVPIWYQKGFLLGGAPTLYLLDLDPPQIHLSDGRVIPGRATRPRAPKGCFSAEDLYTTRFGNVINDEVERYLFGEIDNLGARAVRAFASNDPVAIHSLFMRFFEYLNAQKLRTPKGLDWIKSKYPQLTQVDLMVEMQALRQMHCTMWSECVREIVSAANSDIKFIVTDHPVTIYNAAYPPSSTACKYPEDPAIELKGSQTIFALDANHCLILTNLEYAKSRGSVDLRAPRTNPRYGGQSMVRTDAFVRSRKLDAAQVVSINHVLKARANRYLAAGDKAWLFPEKETSQPWEAIAETLRPPADELWHFGGEMFIGYKDGTTHYQDAFGRTSTAHKYLAKKRPPGPVERNAVCGCGSGHKFKNCCEGIPVRDRPSWDVFSIRERNLMFSRAVQDTLGLRQAGKTWEDVRREITDDQVRQIHEAFDSLWPPDTDLVALLPRPNSRVSRAVFVGIVDPRTIVILVASWLAYFDEIVIPNPFIIGANVNPDYRPTSVPGKYKVQTLRNVLVLLALEPYIAAGVVHLVPDPAEFGGLRHVVWKMAEERVGNFELDEKDEKHAMALSKDEYMRGVRGMPDDALRGFIERHAPELAAADVDGVLRHMKQERQQDPYALLQELPPGEEGAQMLTTRGLNLEVGLFLAQFMGAIMYMDLGVHWNHLHTHTRTGQTRRHSSVWTPVIEQVRKLPFLLTGNVNVSLENRFSGRFDPVRLSLRSLLGHVRAQDQVPIHRKVLQQTINEVEPAMRCLRTAWKSIQPGSEQEEYFQGHIDLSIPSGGFEMNTVRRILLTHGRAAQVQPLYASARITIERV